MMPAHRTPARVLIVDKDVAVASAFGDTLRADGYSCTIASDGPSAMAALAQYPFDVLIYDVAVDALIRLALLEQVAKHNGPLPVVIATALPNGVGASSPGRNVGVHFLSRPSGVRSLETVIEQARAGGEQPSLSGSPPGSAVRGADGGRKRADLPGVPRLLGADRVMAVLQERILRIAASSAPALICGESGSGKDVVAHAIHSQGPRRDRPFVAINTSAIPAALLESELFGHVRGSFSGATDARRGLFLTANGGTLFLDEIGDMPLGLQAKLLRVIELGEVRPIGSDTARTVDVRIIAATHRDLPACICSGQFREDLYFRLNVLSVFVPPLRERRGDIPELALHFLAEARQRMPSSKVRTISEDALQLLSRADWPGNVRELASTIERLVVFARDETITADHLETFAARSSKREARAETNELCTLRELNDRHVAWVLTQTEGNKVRAAEILGVNLSTLYRWKTAGAVDQRGETTTD